MGPATTPHYTTPAKSGNPTFEPAIDRMNSAPFYEQIVVQVRNAILSGALRPGEPFYAEGEMAEKLGISKMPVRQAFERLRTEGLLVTAKGRRPTVGAGETPWNVQDLRGFTEEVRSRGHTPSTKLISMKLVLADAETATALRLGEGELVYRLRRLRFIDGEPAALETTHLSAKLFPKLDKQHLETESLYFVIEKIYSRRLKLADERLGAVTAGREEARLLDVEVGFPLLTARRLVYDVSENLVEFGYSLFRADRYSARVVSYRKD